MAIRRAQDASDVCPVCKSSTYLNKNLIFKVNTECYHKMCDSCIKRIFHDGPNMCPIAGCGKYLRPQRFKVPRFEDLAIERECDIRARVGKILNHQESDFETLRDYNDYEEWKEEIIMLLVDNKDVEETERKLEQYAKENKESITANAEADAEQRKTIEEKERLRLERSELTRAEAIRERQEEAAEREAGRREVVDKILNANADVLKVAKEAEQVVQRRAAARSGAVEAGAAAKNNILVKNAPKSSTPSNSTTASAPTNLTLTSSFKPSGLKKREPKPAPGSTLPKKEEPYDPFAGMELHFKYFTLQEKGYYHPWSNGVDQDPKQAVAGLRAMDYQRRAQLEAHAGLGVFIGDEKGSAT